MRQAAYSSYRLRLHIVYINKIKDSQIIKWDARYLIMKTISINISLTIKQKI
jgi:hypothetical protein